MTYQNETLRAAIDVEIQAYYNGDYADGRCARDQLERFAERLIREQQAEIQQLREALHEMIEEAEDGIAICPLTMIKARNALERNK